MTLGRLLAVVYVLLLGQLRAEFDIAALQAAVARGMGAEVDMPSWHEAKAAFDAELAAPPDPVERGREIELKALGLR